MAQEYKWNEAEKAAILARPQLSRRDVDRELAAYEAKKQEVESLSKRVNRKVKLFVERAAGKFLKNMSCRLRLMYGCHLLQCCILRMHVSISTSALWLATETAINRVLLWPSSSASEFGPIFRGSASTFPHAGGQHV